MDYRDHEAGVTKDHYCVRGRCHLLNALISKIAKGKKRLKILNLGGTFDEHNYLRIAVNTYEAFRTGDFSEKRWEFYSEHPPIGKYVMTLFYAPFISTLSQQEKEVLISGFYPQTTISGEIYNPGRYASLLYAGLTVVIVYLFCLLFLTRTTGIIACSLLAVSPNFISYFKVATLDAPTAFFYTLGVFCFALALKYDSWKWWITLGVVTGLGIATKFNMGLLLFFYAIMFLFWKGPEVWDSAKKVYAKNHDIVYTFKHVVQKLWYWKLFWVPLIAVFVVYLVWPWLWPAPLDRLEYSTSVWDNPGRAGRVYPWFGNMETPHLSAYPVYYFFTTPALVLLLFIFSLIIALKKRSFWDYFLLMWLLLPPLIWTMQFNVVGPNMRYMIMTYPPMMILCALGLQQLFKKQTHLVYAVGALVVYLMVINVWIHPYSLDYYNELIGGPKKVQEGNLFNFNNFAEGKKEITEWINKNSVQGAVVGIKFDPPHDFGGFRPDLKVYDLIYKNYTGDPIYLITNHRYNQYIKPKDIIVHDLSKYQLVHAVKAGNAEFAWIYQLK